jgi:hypothetical protein
MMHAQIDHWLTKPGVDSEEPFPLLYRFMGADGVLKTVESWQLRLSPWLRMNDPREKKEWRSADIIVGRLQAVPPYTQRELERAFDRLLRRGARLACFTDDRAPATEHSARWLLHRGWGRSAMWDRYADSHRGGCLVFNSPALMEQFDTFQLGVSCIRTWGRVEYVDEPISIELEADVRSDEHLMELLDETTSGRHIVSDLYMKKLRDWESEREFRTVEVLWNVPQAEMDEPLHIPIGSSLRAIIIGEMFSEVDLHHLQGRLCSRPEAPELFRCAWHGGVPFLACP